MERSGTRKIRSQAQKDAQRRYYEKNREKRLTQMRQKAAERAEKLKMEAKLNPDALKEAREMMMEKYHRYVENQNNKQIATWLKADDDILAKFVAKYVVPERHNVTRGTYTALDRIISKRSVESDGGADSPEFNFC
jgi:hypothetical protein